MKIKANKIFYFKKGPTRFNLTPTYLYRVENQGYVVLCLKNCLFENLIFLVLKIFFYIFLILEELVFFFKLHFGYRLTRVAL